MTLQELKEKIRDLGFDDDATMSEYADIINNAITRACKTIALTVKAPVGKYELDLSDEEVRSESGHYDLDELCVDEQGNNLFESIERIVTHSGAGIDTFTRWDMEQDHILVVDSSLTTPLTIFYKERILPITENTQDDSNVQVVYQCEPLVGLLAAHYVWLDDDERKAILYWNEYDQLKEEIMAKSLKPKAKVIGGIRWRG